MNIIINIKRIFAVTLLLLLNFVQLFAQGPGLPGGDDCDPDDPDTCEVPLDNWLIILVIGGLILAAWYLHNKQKKEAIS